MGHICCPKEGLRSLPRSKQIAGVPIERLHDKPNWVNNLQHSIGRFCDHIASTTLDDNGHFNRVTLQQIIDHSTVRLDPLFRAYTGISDGNALNAPVVRRPATGRGCAHGSSDANGKGLQQQKGYEGQWRQATHKHQRLIGTSSCI